MTGQTLAVSVLNNAIYLFRITTVDEFWSSFYLKSYLSMTINTTFATQNCFYNSKIKKLFNKSPANAYPNISGQFKYEVVAFFSKTKNIVVFANFLSLPNVFLYIGYYAVLAWFCYILVKLFSLISMKSRQLHLHSALSDSESLLL